MEGKHLRFAVWQCETCHGFAENALFCCIFENRFKRFKIEHAVKIENGKVIIFVRNLEYSYG